MFANVFKTSSLCLFDIPCNCKLNWHRVISRKWFCISKRMFSSGKQEEYQIQRNLTLQKYKESYDRCDEQTKKRDYLYISHKNAADLAVKSYLCSKTPKNELVLEINPGLGILTKALLEAGVTHLRVYEEKSVFLHHLRELRKNYLGQMEIIEDDFLSVPHHPQLREKKFKRLLKGITPRKWIDAPIKVFITLPAKVEKSFMRYLIYSIPKAEGIYKIGRAEFFLFISGKEYSYIVAKPKENYAKYISSTALYSLFCDIQICGKVEKTCFFAPRRVKRSKSSYDNANMYLVKMTPKATIFEDGMTSEKLVELIHFVRRCLRKRKRNVISTLESSIPNCGPHFIKEGITVANRFGDLSPQELLKVFKIFSSLPEYDMVKVQLDITSTEELCEYDSGISTDA